MFVCPEMANVIRETERSGADTPMHPGAFVQISKTIVSAKLMFADKRTFHA